MRGVRVPNIFGTTVKTDPTLLRYASAIIEQINDLQYNDNKITTRYGIKLRVCKRTCKNTTMLRPFAQSQAFI